MEQTSSYTYFSIFSNGKMGGRGWEGTEAGAFEPDDITEILNIEPFAKWKKGDVMERHPQGWLYQFSRWSAEKSDIDRIDAGKQCRESIKNLKNKVPELLEIKSLYDVLFRIMIVPEIRGEKVLLYFEKEIIDFCHCTGTTIDVDMYVFSASPVDAAVQN